jgi:hypothetical protein
VSEPSLPRCTTCGDTSEPMRVVRADAGSEIAICVGEDGARRRVDIGIVGAVAPGETLIVHAGAALSREPR